MPTWLIFHPDVRTRTVQDVSQAIEAEFPTYQLTEDVLRRADSILGQPDVAEAGDWPPEAGWQVVRFRVVVAVRMPVTPKLEPPEAFLFLGTLTNLAAAGNRDQQYSIEFFGVRLSPPDASPPFWGIPPDCLGRLRHARIVPNDCPVCGDVNWDAGGQEHITIEASQARGEDDVVRAWKAVQLLFERVLRAGRPRGTGTFENREAFKAVIGAAVRELRNQHRNPTTGAVLRYLRTGWGKADPSQLTHWYQGFGWPTWQDFLDDLD